MSTRSRHGGRHELGQNFLVHHPTVDRVVGLVAVTDGPVLEIGAGDGALTVPLARLGRDLTAIDLDEHLVRRLRRRLPSVRVEHTDVLRHPLDRPVVVGNVPFHLTTPVLRRLLTRDRWQHAILLAQWEVARKRAGVGGATMMTAQAGPWFTFTLHGRVPAQHFRPAPGADGGLLAVARRTEPLVPARERSGYEAFVRRVFTGRGRTLADVVAGATRSTRREAHALLASCGVAARALPRDLDAGQWARLWRELPRRQGVRHA
ncbi:23S ribosomal RNA methyltransferase Erm [Isoptericola halotolerans]|uniref:23S ribosomal RNA methyltransferase Erm n=1 Tax=Isoptericola halotolerans TaxID=300560 RepID=UPI00388D06E8